MTTIRRIVGVGALLDHNKWRVSAFRQLGVEVFYVATQGQNRLLSALEHRTGLSPQHEVIGRRVRDALMSARSDAVWVDKGLYFTQEDIESWRKHARVIAHYHPDDWQNPAYHWLPFRQSIPAYDIHFTTRPVNVQELYLLGAQRVVKTWFAFEPTVHRMTGRASRVPATVFLGRSDKDRVELLVHLASKGLPLLTYGAGYESLQGFPETQVVELQPLGREYASVIEGATAALGLLARQSRDQHTCRSVEIPACGGVLVAERTPEHEVLFEDGKEALYFSDTDQLAEHLVRLESDVRYNTGLRRQGHERATRSGYDHMSRARETLTILEQVARGS